MIRIASLPAVAMMAVAFYVGAYHLLVWARSRRHRTNLTFALTCFGAAAYDLCCAGLYSAGSAAEGAPWQRLQRLTVALAGVAFAWFIADYTRRAPRRPLYALSALAVGYALLLAGAPQYVFSDEVRALTVSVPWAGAVTYYELAIRPPGFLLELFGGGLFSVSCVAAVRQYRSGERAHAVRLLAALAVLFAGVVNDTAISSRTVASLYSIEYAFLAIVVVMAYSFSERYRQAAEIEGALRDSESLYRSLVEDTDDLALRIDRAGRVLFANRGAEDAFAVPHGALVGLPFLELVHPDQRPQLRATLDGWASGQRVPTRLELRHVTFAERPLEVLWTVTPLADETGHPVWLAAIGLDITERKRAEEEQFARLQRLERQQEAIVRLALDASVVSGDLPTAARRVTEIAADTLGVDRVGVWRSTPANKRIACIDLYERGRRTHSVAPALDVDGSTYFEQIARERVAASHDARTDPRLAELRERRVLTADVGARLDAPLRAAGSFEGAISIEHVGAPRTWLDDEILFAGELADQMAQAILNADRRQTEESLRLSENRYRSMLEAMDDMVYICSSDHRIEYMNPAMVRRIGRDATGDTCHAAIHDLDQICPWCTALATGGSAREIASPRDGRSYHVSHALLPRAAGAAARMLTLRDVTDQRKSEATSALLSAAIEQAGEIVLVTDTNGVIQYVNPAFEHVTGYARTEALGQTPSILKSGRQSAAFYEELWKTIRSGDTWHGRFTNRKKSGALYMEEAVISPVLDPSGRIASFVGVKRDITAQVQLEERLRQAQKMEAVGQLAGGVAHDFNNLLTPILGYAELLQMRFPEEDPTHAALGEIRRAGEGARRLTTQLLAFSRKQVIETQALDLATLVGRLTRMLRRTIREDVEIAYQRAEGPLRVCGDASQLEQVVMNLAINAQDAMPRGGVMTLQVASARVEAENPPHPDLAPGVYVALSVADNGIGMDDETVSHIFEPFFTTKARGKGTGLGLATVYGIVKQHGGEVAVQSEPAKGSVFRIYLPRVDQGPAPEDGTAARRETARGQETILVVEDSESVRRLASSVLRAHGYTVLVADGGKSALALIENTSEPIHLLLADMVMPGMNGAETFRQLALLRPGLRVLYMSGYPQDVLGAQGVLSEGIRLIAKPFSIETLTANVRAVLDAPA